MFMLNHFTSELFSAKSLWQTKRSRVSRRKESTRTNNIGCFVTCHCRGWPLLTPISCATQRQSTALYHVTARAGTARECGAWYFRAWHIEFSTTRVEHGGWHRLSMSLLQDQIMVNKICGFMAADIWDWYELNIELDTSLKFVIHCIRVGRLRRDIVKGKVVCREISIFTIESCNVSKCFLNEDLCGLSHNIYIQHTKHLFVLNFRKELVAQLSYL